VPATLADAQAPQPHDARAAMSNPFTRKLVESLLYESECKHVYCIGGDEFLGG
jgi:hypothetical protein